MLTAIRRASSLVQYLIFSSLSPFDASGKPCAATLICCSAPHSDDYFWEQILLFAVIFYRVLSRELGDVLFSHGNRGFVGAIGNPSRIVGVENCDRKIASAPERPGGAVP
jgi:hypothetical protein